MRVVYLDDTTHDGGEMLGDIVRSDLATRATQKPLIRAKQMPHTGSKIYKTARTHVERADRNDVGDHERDQRRRVA